ncbi:MAG: glycosyltransferase family 39 protein [Bacteroidia bacterium]|nr:glycosyltransferase family 39 protein [Bacteroidia bacterium]
MIKQFLLKHPYTFFFGLATLVYVIGIVYVPLMDVDATQYASISLEMLNSGDYLHVIHHEKDYLDKPPLIFWLGALFYKLFGVHVWSYRLPSFLFTILGIYSTYALGKLFYGKKTGLNAALIIYTTQAFFLMNHDVRTDTILTACIIFSSWQLAEFLQSGRFIYVLGGFTGIALGMLEKGPLGLVVPIMAIGTHILVRRDWKTLFKWQWLAGLLLTAVLLIPMCIGLYEQFDLHPEKVVNGRQGVSGLRFFFWEQSFGRITGENVWKDDSTVLFFTHTFVWSFIPWFLPAIMAFFSRLGQLIRSGFKSTETEFLTLGGFLLPFIALSLSHYKLPHYVFVLYPFAAIFTASWLSELELKPSSFLKWTKVQSILCLVMALLLVVFNVWFFPVYTSLYVSIATVLLLVLLLYAYRQYKHLPEIKLYSVSVFTAVFINFLLNTNFYPQLLNYQGGTVASRYVKGKNIRADNCYSLNETSFALDVNTGINWVDGTPERIEKALKVKDELWLFTNHDGFMFAKDNYIISDYKRIEHFHVTAMTLPFLNPSTRKEVLEERYILQLKGLLREKK